MGHSSLLIEFKRIPFGNVFNGKLTIFEDRNFITMGTGGAPPCISLFSEILHGGNVVGGNELSSEFLNGHSCHIEHVVHERPAEGDHRQFFLRIRYQYADDSACLNTDLVISPHSATQKMDILWRKMVCKTLIINITI